MRIIMIDMRSKRKKLILNLYNLKVINNYFSRHSIGQSGLMSDLSFLKVDLKF